MIARNLLIVGVVLVGFATTGRTLFADDRYYMLMFASQGEANAPALSHTYAVFVKTPAAAHTISEVRCISWLPSSLRIQLLRLRPEPGKNLSLEETNRWARDLDAQITMWGPFQIKKVLYDMAVLQAERLNRKELGYKALDWRFREGAAVSCSHAVSDLDTTQPLLETGPAHGNEASLMVLHHFQRYMIPSNKSITWLTDRLHLKSSEIHFATLPAPIASSKGPPTSKRLGRPWN